MIAQNQRRQRARALKSDVAASADRTTAAPGGRAPWGTMSRPQIVDEATKVVEAGGYQEMTIRSLAAELGVAPMSLYRHVRDKDDLLDEVVDRLLARSWKPRGDDSDGRAWVAKAAERLCTFLIDQPAALHIYLSHPVVSPAAIARMQAMMEVLRKMGADEQEARRAYGAIHTYTIGFAALAASRAGWHAPEEGRGIEVATQLAAYTTARQFAVGLDFLLEGIVHRTEISGSA